MLFLRAAAKMSPPLRPKSRPAARDTSSTGRNFTLLARCYRTSCQSLRSTGKAGRISRLPIAQPGERRPRRVRQPSRCLSQIDDCRPVGAPQNFDHQRQLAAVSRGGHPNRVAAFVRTGASLRLRLRRLTVLGRVLRSLVDGDGFQTGSRQFERVTLSSVIAPPDRRSRFRLDLAGQTKLRKFGTDFAESCALDRCRRRQATVLASCRGAHHHKLCVGKFDTHDPTLPLVLEVRAIRPLHQDEPRIGQSRRGGWVMRGLFAPRLTTTPMLEVERKASPSCMAWATVVNGRISFSGGSYLGGIAPLPQRS